MNVRLLDAASEFKGESSWDEPNFTPDEDIPPENPSDFASLFGAPDFSDLIQKPRSGEAAKYEKRMRALMKAGLTGAMNAEQYPDAAAFLKHGPAFAAATGALAAENKYVKGMVDIITAPDSTALIFAATAIPLVAQLLRNHQPQAERLGQEFKKGWKERRAERKAQRNDPSYKRPEPKFSIRVPILRKRIPIRFNVSLRFQFAKGAIMSQTQSPDSLANEVFNDPNVRKAMHKAGFNVPAK